MRRDPGRRGSTSRGSTLLFFPAALLVVVVLASVTVDFARVHLGQRQADDLAAAVANDAVTVGLDEAALRSGTGYHLDRNRVDALVADRRARADRSTLHDLRVAASLTSPRSVEVTVQARVPLAFARALPGAPAVVPIRGRATATAHLR